MENICNPYEKYERINRLNIFNNLRKFHQHIKFFYLKKYFNQGIIIDIGSSDLKLSLIHI